MIPIEFGIIDEIDKNKRYITYEPEKYNCITIDDDIYSDDWWELTQKYKMRTYIGGDFNKPYFALDRHGVTIIPPESLSIFEEIVSNDPRIEQDNNLMELLKLIRKAKQENKYMIHYGV